MDAERANPGTEPEAVGTRKLRLHRRRWFQVLAAGVLFYALIQASYLAFTNLTLIPAMMIYGALIVPAAFMVYLYDELEATELHVAAFVAAASLPSLFDTTLQLQEEPSWVGVLAVARLHRGLRLPPLADGQDRQEDPRGDGRAAEIPDLTQSPECVEEPF